MSIIWHRLKNIIKTIRILHDVDKHIRAIENLYGTEREHTAGEYAEAIRSTLAPLIPMSYTENPILNILLTDKNAVMQEKGIHSDIKIDNVELSYIEPIDITTIFGNLLDNAIELLQMLTEKNTFLLKSVPIIR